MGGLLGEWRGIFQFARRSSFRALASAQRGDTPIERIVAARHSSESGRKVFIWNGNCKSGWAGSRLSWLGGEKNEVSRQAASYLSPAIASPATTKANPPSPICNCRSK